MAFYRVYVVEADGHFALPPEIIECDSDTQAVHLARRYIDGKPLEVWHEARCIAKLGPDA